MAHSTHGGLRLVINGLPRCSGCRSSENVFASDDLRGWAFECSACNIHFNALKPPVDDGDYRAPKKIHTKKFSATGRYRVTMNSRIPVISVNSIG